MLSLLGWRSMGFRFMVFVWCTDRADRAVNDVVMDEGPRGGLCCVSLNGAGDGSKSEEEEWEPHTTMERAILWPCMWLVAY